MLSPLAGITVLDFTVSLAGPYCTQILASLGADVVKIEHPTRGDDTRTWGPPFWNGESAVYLALNAGKRSLAVDVKADAGREAVLRLAQRADVFVQNMRPGLVQRLGLDFDALSACSDRIVYCSIGAFGTVGPLSHQPGYDPLMQAAGGIMSLTGEPGRPPVRAGVSVVDQGTGMWAVIAILAALRARDLGAGAQLIDLSLYETALNWLPYQLVGYLANGRVPEPQGSGLGIIAPYEAFASRDGWVMIAAGNDRLFAALCGVLDLPELVEDPRFRTNPDRVANRRELATLIAGTFARQSSSEWLARLDQAGVPAAPIQNLAEVVESEQTKALEILQPLPHPKISNLRLVAPPLSVNAERLRFQAPPPALGEHAAEILRSAGYSDQEIDSLSEQGVIRCRRS